MGYRTLHNYFDGLTVIARSLEYAVPTGLHRTVSTLQVVIT
jgi:hypothetical protein